MVGLLGEGAGLEVGGAGDEGDGLGFGEEFDLVAGVVVADAAGEVADGDDGVAGEGFFAENAAVAGLADGDFGAVGFEGVLDGAFAELAEEGEGDDEGDNGAEGDPEDAEGGGEEGEEGVEDFEEAVAFGGGLEFDVIEDEDADEDEEDAHGDAEEGGDGLDGGAGGDGDGEGVLGWVGDGVGRW